MGDDKLITIAIYTYEKAQIIKGILENEDIPVAIQNVNLIQPVISSGVRVRIREQDLPHALQILEQYSLFDDKDHQKDKSKNHEKKILIPVDFSDYSFKACQIGFDFAKAHNAKVMLFHAYFSPYFPGAIPITDTFTYEVSEDEALKQVQDRVGKDMARFVETLHKQIAEGLLPDVEFDYILREGIPEDEINHYSKEYNPMLIVMGTRGKSQKELDLIGSVTAEVLDSTKFPVFAVPESVPFTMIDEVNNIAFFTNFDQQDLIAIDTFMRLFGSYDFKVNFVHMNTKRDAWNEIKLAGMKEYFDKHYPGREVAYMMLNGDDFLNSVEKFIRDEKIDILTMTTRKRNILSRFINPSIAHKMLFHADTPLLVIPSVGW